ncbi:Protein CBG27154 [Caenorhabditis briggsae]|uniref:Protein CBG27154 n=1 Tax=Caenorhabditis briggsae TaxID=6238 RepID=B6IL64_CAEBR|nr:Protein CBG27154 [Caenorhabditis briggsae]CAS00617.1 Protein CBG27154 [Caenorhabditis briggsae]
MFCQSRITFFWLLVLKGRGHPVVGGGGKKQKKKRRVVANRSGWDPLNNCRKRGTPNIHMGPSCGPNECRVGAADKKRKEAGLEEKEITLEGIRSSPVCINMCIHKSTKWKKIYEKHMKTLSKTMTKCKTKTRRRSKRREDWLNDGDGCGDGDGDGMMWKLDTAAFSETQKALERTVGARKRCRVGVAHIRSIEGREDPGGDENSALCTTDAGGCPLRTLHYFEKKKKRERKRRSRTLQMLLVWWFMILQRVQQVFFQKKKEDGSERRENTQPAGPVLFCPPIF